MQRRRPHPHAFTLLELVLVLVIMAIISAIVVPSLRAFGVGRATNNAAVTLIGLGNYARTQAAAEGQTYRLNFDPSAGQVWLTVQSDDGTFTPAKGDYGDRYPLPEGVRMDVTVSPQANVRPAASSDVQQTTDTPAVPFGQALADANKLVLTTHVDGTYVEFQPGGRTDPVRVHLTDKLGGVVDVGCQSATESMHVLTAGEL